MKIQTQYQDKQVEEFTEMLELHPEERIFIINSKNKSKELWFCGSVIHSKNFFDYGWVCALKAEHLDT